MIAHRNTATNTETSRYDVAVVGLGHTGIPLAVSFAKAGYRCLGFDTDDDKVENLPYHLITDDGACDALASGRLRFTNEEEHLCESRAILVCVPTPLARHHEPDLTYIVAAAKEIAPHIRPGMLISLESSAYPGTTQNEFRALLEEGSGLVAGDDFHLAFSPEIDEPGHEMDPISHTPKVIGGLTKECLKRACELYGKAIENIVPVSSCMTAEAVKLTENIFRFVNIGLVNELKTVFTDMNIDIWEIQQAAKAKPFGFMPFYPSVGVGGNRTPVEPYYLSWKAKEHDRDCRFIDLAGQINHSMPSYVANRLADAMNHVGRPLYGARVLVLGVAYKPDIPDDRDSQSYKVMNLLRKKDTRIDYYDPYIKLIPNNRGEWSQLHSIPWDEDLISKYDCAVVCTGHQIVDYNLLADHIPLIVDACNVVPKNRKAYVVSA